MDLSIELSPWKEVLGNLVKEEDFSKYGKERVAALVLWEITWFGYSEEDIRKKKAEKGR